MAAPRTNQLLDALSPGSRKRLIDLSKTVDLPVRTQLQAQDEQPKHAYIMLTGIASVVVNLPEGGSAEAAVIGREGITSCFSLFGPSASPSECFMQVAGSG